MSGKGGIHLYLMPTSPTNHLCGALEGLRSLGLHTEGLFLASPMTSVWGTTCVRIASWGVGIRWAAVETRSCTETRHPQHGGEVTLPPDSGSLPFCPLCHLTRRQSERKTGWWGWRRSSHSPLQRKKAFGSCPNLYTHCLGSLADSSPLWASVFSCESGTTLTYRTG